MAFFTTLIVGLIVIGISALFGYAIYWLKRKKSIAASQEDIAKPNHWYKRITNDLFFDEACGRLRYKQEIIQLNGRIQQKLFSLLLNASPNHLVSYEEMRKEIWRDKPVSNNTIYKNYKRLKNKLFTVPDITLETIDRVGYQLHIKRNKPKSRVLKNIKILSLLVHVNYLIFLCGIFVYDTKTEDGLSIEKRSSFFAE